MIKVEPIGANEASREYTELWETIVEQFPMLSNRQVAKVVSLVVGICHHCYASPVGCQCDAALAQFTLRHYSPLSGLIAAGD